MGEEDTFFEHIRLVKMCVQINEINENDCHKSMQIDKMKKRR